MNLFWGVFQDAVWVAYIKMQPPNGPPVSLWSWKDHVAHQYSRPYFYLFIIISIFLWYNHRSLNLLIESKFHKTNLENTFLTATFFQIVPKIFIWLLNNIFWKKKILKFPHIFKLSTCSNWNVLRYKDNFQLILIPK